MPTEPRAGRPKVSSRETLAEAACELFLERGYAATSVGDIAARAGVSRSSFFNYFASKADILWSGLDERLDTAISRLEAGDAVGAALSAALAGFAPDSLALAIVNAEPMGLESELPREASVRRARLAEAVARRLGRDGVERMRAEIAGAAYAAAVLSAVWAWAHEGAGRAPLQPTMQRALAMVPGVVPESRVSQLRVVVRADDLDRAVAFYRDALGLVEQESYDGDEGARVVILGAGRATLELSNPEQVRFIDRVETDGVTSPHIRLAFEVEDSALVTSELEAAGAEILASARETPWRSVNARLTAPADLQLTLFQELGPES
ncbi:TetR family transcriptional regulator [Microbacterium sp. ASV49]|uniref:TetR family transcriptional regulator n=1 Tax=Microbacterium candidum TaxID=3041922 RepID=A0ABT7MZX4_9MICO|nr:TetR family transcriptional regulator [Microbacterium sp. ASV49]MDL9980000.1 TetR family transcriptional regulator [Microbacterium sp. ASV49]